MLFADYISSVDMTVAVWIKVWRFCTATVHARQTLLTSLERAVLTPSTSWLSVVQRLRSEPFCTWPRQLVGSIIQFPVPSGPPGPTRSSRSRLVLQVSSGPLSPVWSSQSHLVLLVPSSLPSPIWSSQSRLVLPVPSGPLSPVWSS